MTLVVAFWLAALCVIYAYAGYPLFIAALARFRRARQKTFPAFSGSVSILLVVYNEERHVVQRVQELLKWTKLIDNPCDIIVVSDGSTDATTALVRQIQHPAVSLLALSENMGKAAALSQGCTQSQSDVLVLADVRQRWAPDALGWLLRPFSDPQVGAVSGELILESSPGVLSGVGLYWRYEKWIRQQESAYDSVIGVSGSISAVRRALMPVIPRGALLDDVYWPLRVAMQGYRVVHESRALAFDSLPAQARDEFRRKIRTLSGNFQLLQLLPTTLWPWTNRLWFQWVSHKLLRLLVPWALLALLMLSALLPGNVYRSLFLLQVIFYVLGIVGLTSVTRIGHRFTSAAGSFLMLNCAAWCAFWIWISGRADRSWRKVQYTKDTNPGP